MNRASGDALRFESVGFRYGAYDPWVVRDCSGSIPFGSVCAVLGPNGSGKTTLLKLLLGSLHPTEGQVLRAGIVAFVPQLFQVAFPYTVLDIVLMGRARHVGRFSVPAGADERAAQHALERVNLAHLAFRPFDELSGGQRQLVVFARALAAGANILVLDEPTSALDFKNQEFVLEWLAKLARDDGLGIIFSTHNPQHAQVVADRALLLLGPSHYTLGPTDEVISEESLFSLYGVPFRILDLLPEEASPRTIVPAGPWVRQRAK